MLTLLTLVPLSLILVLAAGSLLSLSGSDKWFVRGWDFPRVQIIVTGWLLAFGEFLVFYFSEQTSTQTSTWPVWTASVVAVLLTGWHGFRIYPYTPLGVKQAKATESVDIADHRKDHRADQRKDQTTVRVVISNVEMENDAYAKWLRVMRQADPDVLVVLEPDHAWTEAIKSYTDAFEHRVIVPQENWYGMMMLSKLPIEKHRVRYLVKEDVPSIDAVVRLDDNRAMRMVAVHPRPPEPIRGNHATARDAELTLWGKELAKESRPTIIGGDLNDVAWSATTRLFLGTSGMLDPRRGRGMFNTFHADRFGMRFPLDHVFFSPHFTLARMQTLDNVGSDHFPILIELCHEPTASDEHEIMAQKGIQGVKADEKIQRAIEDDDAQGEAVEQQDTDEANCIEI
ncbi:endonuclease/exonuclease/phosphatase family protein [Stieleria sp. JC731]|uniref:endonuclease/exonuclease/phosphatase family protein n=1 Tax=Pirellulaceae TaxID=2691357 RepID=UPI001E4707C4|nr:endonuclease/exonuclease/phosphatase family protein [Stieleria sp. JC731]MCC9602100.1 endonuclease/exonuclease/phosphatase family protein [Stieleria sp. JC731]